MTETDQSRSWNSVINVLLSGNKTMILSLVRWHLRTPEFVLEHDVRENGAVVLDGKVGWYK
jgi:hypothetical protein